MNKMRSKIELPLLLSLAPLLLHLLMTHLKRRNWEQHCPSLGKVLALCYIMVAVGSDANLE